MNFPKNPGHVVVGIEKISGQVSVYAYLTQKGERIRQDFPWDPTTGHVLFLAEQVIDAAVDAGAEAVSGSSSLDFWEEAIA